MFSLILEGNLRVICDILFHKDSCTYVCHSMQFKYITEYYYSTSLLVHLREIHPYSLFPPQLLTFPRVFVDNESYSWDQRGIVRGYKPTPLPSAISKDFLTIWAHCISTDTPELREAPWINRVWPKKITKWAGWGSDPNLLLEIHWINQYPITVFT